MTLLSISDLARRWRITRQSAHKRVNKAGFPPPVATTGAGRVWTEKAIEGWERAKTDTDAPSRSL